MLRRESMSIQWKSFGSYRENRIVTCSRRRKWLNHHPPHLPTQLHWVSVGERDLQNSATHSVSCFPSFCFVFWMSENLQRLRRCFSFVNRKRFGRVKENSFCWNIARNIPVLRQRRPLFTESLKSGFLSLVFSRVSC